MKNLKQMAERSKKGITPLYYSPKMDAVYSTPGDGRFLLTKLIRENTPKEIERTVYKFMAM